MAIMDPDPVAVIFAVTFHGIVCEITLSNLIVGIYDNLEKKQAKTNLDTL